MHSLGRQLLMRPLRSASPYMSNSFSRWSGVFQSYGIGGGGRRCMMGSGGHGAYHVNQTHKKVGEAFLTVMFTWMGIRMYEDGMVLLVSGILILCYFTRCTLTLTLRTTHSSYYHDPVLVNDVIFSPPRLCVRRALNTRGITWIMNHMRVPTSHS